jgi:hypothetical protein
LHRIGRKHRLQRRVQLRRGSCVPATVSCAAHKSSYPSSGDGVYWIGPPAMRAYCDMRVPIALCTEVTEEHSGGRTRDGSNATFALTSVLLWSQGECAIWALRALPRGFPSDRIAAPTRSPPVRRSASSLTDSSATAPTATAPDTTACGFGAPPLYQMGDDCAGCVVGDGPHELYVRQGPVHQSQRAHQLRSEHADPLQGDEVTAKMTSR